MAWRRRAPYGRIDFAYDGGGPAKLYELNYDTPTSLYESAYFQWLWLEQQINAGRLPVGTDQYNGIQENLCETFATLARDKRIGARVHFAAVRDSAEDQATVLYLRDCAHQAGVDTALIAVEDIGLSAEGWFTDTDDGVIQTLFKLYPLEFMMEEEFGPSLVADRMQLLEPPWKAILSIMLLLPLISHFFEFLIQFAFAYVTSTQDHTDEAILRSISFSIVSALFTLFAMRRGLMIVGDSESKSLLSDISKLPVVIFYFIVFIPNEIAGMLRRGAYLGALLSFFVFGIFSQITVWALVNKPFWTYGGGKSVALLKFWGVDGIILLLLVTFISAATHGRRQRL